MPPKATTNKQTTKCLKFAEILIDENRRFLYLCAQCFLDFAEFNDLRQHLKTCDSVSHIFKAQNHTKINFDSGTKLLTKVIKDPKELHIYGIDRVAREDEISKENGDISDFLDIEEELLNPRWFNDTTPKDEIEANFLNKKEETSYSDLIMEVTPFVQFKENLKTNTTSGRVMTRETAKQNASKELGEKSNTIAMQNKKKPEKSMAPARLYLSDDKKHILRATLEQSVKPSATASRESNVRLAKSEVYKNMAAKKPLVKTNVSTKNTKETTMITMTEKEKMPTTSTPALSSSSSSTPSEKSSSLKRKIVSLPVATSTPRNDVESHNMVKRPRIISSPANESKGNKLTIQQRTSPTKSAPNALPVLMKGQKAIIVSNKKENKTVVSSTQNSNLSKEQNVLPSNRQSLPQRQTQIHGKQQLQVKASTMPKTSLQSLKGDIKRSSNQPILLNKNCKILTKESPHIVTAVTTAASSAAAAAAATTSTATQFVQHIPAASSATIPKKILNYPSTTIQKSSSTESSNQKTVAILNKLQTLGLKVQRTNPTPEQQCPKKPRAANEQALEIIKKLQSKGMNVKIVQKPTTTMKVSATQPFTVVHNPSAHIVTASQGNSAKNLPTFGTINCNITDQNTVLVSNPNFSKNVLIKKFT